MFRVGQNESALLSRLVLNEKFKNFVTDLIGTSSIVARKIIIMVLNIRFAALIAFCFLTLLIHPVMAEDGKIRWSLTVVTLDGVDQYQKAEIPVKEAVSFIEARTRLVFDVKYVSEYGSRELTPYATGPDYDGDGIGDEFAYLMMGWNLSDSVQASLPLSTSYLFLYSLNGYRPLQAGSAVPLEYGIFKGGKNRPYASAPTDQWWYENEPYEGFRSRAAQILTHEIINTIQAKIETAPYNCRQLLATTPGLNATEYESERLLQLDKTCYKKLGDNAN